MKVPRKVDGSVDVIIEMTPGLKKGAISMEQRYYAARGHEQADPWDDVL
jgi:hypothetical protein